MLLSPMNNAGSLLAQRTLGMANARVQRTLVSLSTGLSINRGADGPAGLMSSEYLRSQLNALDAAGRNIERARSVVDVADAGLSEVGSLLSELDGKIVEASNSAGMSDAERDAIQLEVDSILSSIDRIAGTTSFAGQSLIDGRRMHEVSDVADSVESVEVYATDMAPGEQMSVDVTVTEAAEAAGLVLSFGSGSLDLGGPAPDDGAGETFDVTVQGADGEVSFSFASGTTLDDVAAMINDHAGETGVEARVSGTSVVLSGSELGSDSFVSVEVADDGGLDAPADAGVYRLTEGDPSTVDASSQVAFADASNPVSDQGRDVAGMINGVAAIGDGASLSIDTMHLSVRVDLSEEAAPPGEASAVSEGSTSAFTVTAGPSFMTGPGVNSTNRIGLGFMGTRTSHLGRFTEDGQTRSLADLRTGGALSINEGDLSGAKRAVRNAIEQVSKERGRLGAFSSGTLDARFRSLTGSFVNTASALSSIRDTDFAFATASLARDQTLARSSLGMLSVFNTTASGALGLLGAPGA